MGNRPALLPSFARLGRRDVCPYVVSGGGGKHKVPQLRSGWQWSCRLSVARSPTERPGALPFPPFEKHERWESGRS